MLKRITTLAVFGLASGLAMANDFDYDFDRDFSSRRSRRTTRSMRREDDNPFVEINLLAPKLFDLALNFGAQINTYSPITVELNADFAFAGLLNTMFADGATDPNKNSYQSSIAFSKVELNARWHLNDDRSKGFYGIVGAGFEITGPDLIAKGGDGAGSGDYAIYGILGVGYKHLAIEGLLSISNRVFYKKEIYRIAGSDSGTSGMFGYKFDQQYFNTLLAGLNFELLRFEFTVV